MSLSGHKIYGPKGVGALFVANSIKNTLRPLMSGGGQEQNLRSGTLSPALCIGIGEACKDIKENRFKKILFSSRVFKLSKIKYEF